MDDVRYVLTNTIKASALALGFSKVGIARAEALTAEGKHLAEWLRRDYHGTMGWMEKDPERRADPRLIVSDARSVISVAVNYYTEEVHSEDRTVGRISRYAWGDDYHILLTGRLESLVGSIKQVSPDAVTRLYVDTGPVMDKAWAVRAGIGWLGKHTNVITKELGSWVFLGEIITDLDLVYDEPMADFCGSCRACIDACPTDAIVEPYALDSNRCISYLTIEHRGEIPDHLSPKFENWVYGCDICQDVCPWNSFQQPTAEEAFQPRSHNLAPKLDELSELTKEEFTERFRRSPIKRTKREGLARNANAIMKSPKG
ncbi:MAG: tRNA epoxyqueuosine(34) reductase QueG [Bacteroidota bacterium]